MLFQAQEPAVPDYDVVIEFDTHYAPGLDELAGDVDIVLAGGGVAAGVVVGHDDAAALSWLAVLNIFLRWTMLALGLPTDTVSLHRSLLLVSK